MPDAASATELPMVRRLREKLDESPAAEHFYVTLLGLSTWDSAGLHERVQEGLSYAALERLRRVLDIPIARFTELIWIAPRTIARRKETGRQREAFARLHLRLGRVRESDLEQRRGPHGDRRRDAPGDRAGPSVRRGPDRSRDQPQRLHAR